MPAGGASIPNNGIRSELIKLSFFRLVADLILCRSLTNRNCVYYDPRYNYPTRPTQVDPITSSTVPSVVY